MQNKKYFWGMFGTNILLILFLGLSFFGKKATLPTIQVPYISLEDQLISQSKNAINTVVQIIAEDPLGGENKNILKKGSGIIIAKEGYIITNNHVIDNKDLEYSIITFDGKKFPVKKIRKDDLLDLAFLSLDMELPFETTAKFISLDSSVSVGQFVFAIGNPLSEYPNTVSFGIISGKGRKLSLEGLNTSYYAGLYQTDLALNPGNSGGPLLTLSGETIGMITAISRGGNNIGFAVPLTDEFIATTLSLLKQYDTLIRPYLGILYTDNFSGAKIDTVFVDSPLQGKILEKDIVLAVDKRPISSTTPLLYYLYTYKPGDTIVFTIDRQGEILSLPIVLGQKTL